MIAAILLPNGEIEIGADDSTSHNDILVHLIEIGRVTEEQVLNYELDFGDMIGDTYVSKGNYR